MTTYRVDLAGIVETILQLDDAGMREALGGIRVVGYRRRGRGGTITIEGDERAMRAVLRDLDDRGASGGREGWDQPSHWASAARVAAERVRRALRAP